MICKHKVDTNKKVCQQCANIVAEALRETDVKQQKEELDYFDLDGMDLDKEWSRQAQLYLQHALTLAEARADWERSKSDKEMVVAELDKHIRSAPIQFGIEKLTETVVERTVILQPRYIKAQEKVIQAKLKVDTMQAMVDAMDHRKKGLECLTTLWVHSYYAEPRAPQGGEVLTAGKELDGAFKGRGKKRRDEA